MPLQAHTAKEVKKLEKQIKQISKLIPITNEEWKKSVRTLEPDNEKHFDDYKQLMRLQQILEETVARINDELSASHYNRYTAQQRAKRYGQQITLKPTGNINTSFHVQGTLTFEDDWAFSVKVAKTDFDHTIGTEQTFRKSNWEEVIT